MLRKLMVLAMLVCTFGVLSAGAGASDASLDLAYDSGPKFPGARDMVGPATGWVIARQRSNGDLQINVQVRGADANTTYFVTVYCGPTHANAMAAVDFDDIVTTDATGRGGNTNIVVTAANIAASCGAGSHTGHIDLDSGFPTFSTLAASPLNFSSP